jgi:hypothetical protein
MKSFRADLILWGLFQGLVAYLVLAWIAPQWQGNLQALSAIGLLGAAMSAIVFGLVRGTRPGTPPLGFIVVSSLLPLVAVLGGDTLHYGRPYFAGPLTLAFAMLWAILLLPSALGGMLLFSRRRR